MPYGIGLLTLVQLGLLVYCVLNVITTPEDQVRNLPKLLWLLLVIVLPLVGCIAWLVAGRPQGPAAALPYKGNQGLPPPAGRPRRTTPRAPDDDEAFLRGLRERAEQQRSAERRRRADRERTTDRDGDDPRSSTP